jgi:hypothetical protein
MPSRNGEPTQSQQLLAHNLRSARRRAKLGPGELASKLFVSPKSIQRYEAGDRDLVEAWERECGVTDGSLTSLFDGFHDSEPVAATSPYAPPDSAAADSPSGWRGRRAPWVLAGVAAVAAAAVVLVVLLSSGNGSAPTTSSSGAEPRPGWDHKDPQESGCSGTTEILDRVPVRNNGRTVGTLQLRGSTSCQTAWGRVVLHQTHAPPFVIEVTRPLDGARDVYRYDKPAEVVFGNMLKHENGCVRAAVTVGRARPIRAQTSCRR